MKILTVIVTYNSMQWIERCITMLQRSTVPTDVIVIDNCSKDDTRNFIPQHYPEVIWKPQDKNLGFGRGNNIGMRYALDNNYDYVLLLNQDAYLQPDALELMLRHGKGNALLTPIHMNGDGTKVDFMFKNSSLLKADNSLVDDLLTGQTKSIYPIGEFCAACWFLPIEVIRKIGGFNPLFSHYGEDNNYYQRLIYHNIPSYVIPQARVWHDRKIHGNSAAFNKKLVEREMLINAANPNKSNPARKLMEFLKIGYKYIAHPLQLCSSTFKLLSMTGKIRRSIKTDRTQDTNWL